MLSGWPVLPTAAWLNKSWVLIKGEDLSRLFVLVFSVAVILINVHAQGVYADVVDPVVIDFEDMDPCSIYQTGENFSSSIAQIILEDPIGVDPNVSVSTDNYAGGSGKELGAIRNITLNIDFGLSVDSLGFKYYDGGDNLKLEVNGQLVEDFDNFEDINDLEVGGAIVSVVTGDPNQGEFSILGTVYSFKLGGSLIWIDDLTVLPAPPTTFHVNVDGDDSKTGLSKYSAFATVGKAIETARDGENVLVHPGTYSEAISFSGKAITVASATTPAVLEAPDPNDTALTFFGGEGADSVLKNFIITNSDRAISCIEGSSPTLKNLTIVNNEFGVEAYTNSSPEIINCIFWNNATGDHTLLDGDSGCVVTFSCTEQGSAGEGNISVDPQFVQLAYRDDNGTPGDPGDDYDVEGDYHLKSMGWRWIDLATPHGNWVWDFDPPVTSRCIDAGNPGCLLEAEPMNIPFDPANDYCGENIRVNMGAYGGTEQASLPPEKHAILSDINNDGIVSGHDLFSFCRDWLGTDTHQPGDLDRNGIVNLPDFALFGLDWMLITDWGKGIDLKDYWPFAVSNRWQSESLGGDSFTYEITDSNNLGELVVWEFTNDYEIASVPLTETHYYFYQDSTLYSTTDVNDLDDLPEIGGQIQARLPEVMYSGETVNAAGYGVVHAVKGSLSYVLKNSDLSVSDFPGGENYDVFALVVDYLQPSETVVAVFGRGVGPLLMSSEYTGELIIVDTTIWE